MQENLQNKKDLVKNVFNQVYNNYDLMNDLMSFGVHRIWKKNLINLLAHLIRTYLYSLLP